MTDVKSFTYYHNVESTIDTCIREAGASFIEKYNIDSVGYFITNEQIHLINIFYEKGFDHALTAGILLNSYGYKLLSKNRYSDAIQVFEAAKYSGPLCAANVNDLRYKPIGKVYDGANAGVAKALACCDTPLYDESWLDQ